MARAVLDRSFLRSTGTRAIRGSVLRLRLVLWSGSVLAFASAPAAAKEPPAPAPEATPFVEAIPPPSARGALALAGAGMFVGWYGAAIGQSFLWPDATEAKQLRIPLVGPWLTLAHAGCGSTEAGCTDLLAVFRAVVAGISAVGQAGGLLAVGEAAFLPTPRGERAQRPRRVVRVENVNVSVVGQGFGVGFSGQF